MEPRGTFSPGDMAESMFSYKGSNTLNKLVHFKISFDFQILMLAQETSITVTWKTWFLLLV